MIFSKCRERALQFKDKRLFIAPYTPKTTMFLQELQEETAFTFLGFLDNFQTGENISKPHDISEPFDAVLILSANHGDAIFEDFSKKMDSNKLIKVEAHGSIYHYLDANAARQNLKRQKAKKRRQLLLSFFTKLLDLIGYKRSLLAFVSKGSITSNNKALFAHCHREKFPCVMLTDNQKELRELRELGMNGVNLETLRGYLLMAKAKWIIQDQANLTKEINLLSPKQKTLQMWHGIPLKRLNPLTMVSYDYLVSTSDFVNETTLSKVINAKEYKDFGYPRNDLLLKEEHDDYDLLFCDRAIYEFAKSHHGGEHKILLYMPTHRESSKAAKIPLDFEMLNSALQSLNATLIVKLHHFVQTQYESENYSNILFHATHGDVYPLLKYTNALITDYSSVYFDFLLLNRPIIFFDYDREEYEANMQGFLYEYEAFTPGAHVSDQEELHRALKKFSTLDDKKMPLQRDLLRKKLYRYRDSDTSPRITAALFKQT
jgi:CDP-glycerol glycerophosphotransferase (TagB/SpsB family)